MTMTPETFRDLLDEAVREQPPLTGAGRELVVGRRLLRRRRLVSAVGATAAAAVFASGGAFALQVDLGPENRDRALERPTTDADLLQSCREGNQSDRATDLIFGSGTPTVTSVVRTRFQAILAIESAGGRYWADCFVHFTSQEFHSGMSVWDGNQRSRGTGYSVGPGCGLAQNTAETCSAWHVSQVDRLQPEIAAVRYDLGDGTSHTRPTEDGYVVLNVLNELPPEGRIGPDGTVRGFFPIQQVTYLDAAGEALAASRLDGSGVGRERDRVEGLPPLSDYPSLGRDVIY